MWRGERRRGRGTYRGRRGGRGEHWQYGRSVSDYTNDRRRHYGPPDRDVRTVASDGGTRRRPDSWRRKQSDPEGASRPDRKSAQGASRPADATSEAASPESEVASGDWSVVTNKKPYTRSERPPTDRRGRGVGTRWDEGGRWDDRRGRGGRGGQASDRGYRGRGRGGWNPRGRGRGGFRSESGRGRAN